LSPQAKAVVPLNTATATNNALPVNLRITLRSTV